VEVDPKVGLRGFEGVKALIDAYAWAIDVEICVMPQEGMLNNPGTEELMIAGLRSGARVIGAAPGYDTDRAGQIRRVFEIARDFDVDIDMHLDTGSVPDELDTNLVCELTDQYGWGGRVAIGHGAEFRGRGTARRGGRHIARLPGRYLFTRIEQHPEPLYAFR
jgi:cytosine deaminase